MLPKVPRTHLPAHRVRDPDHLVPVQGHQVLDLDHLVPVQGQVVLDLHAIHHVVQYVQMAVRDRQVYRAFHVPLLVDSLVHQHVITHVHLHASQHVASCAILLLHIQHQGVYQQQDVRVVVIEIATMLVTNIVYITVSVLAISYVRVSVQIQPARKWIRKSVDHGRMERLRTLRS